MRHLVKVVIPIYRKEIKDWERLSLANTFNILTAHPIVILKPVDLDLTEFFTNPPFTSSRFEIVNVSSDWLGTKRGIAGYNEMMMSKAFYELFLDTDYLFICHTDAWVFRDELADWCHRGYDSVAAPWPERPCYKHFPLKQYIWLRKKLTPSGRLVRQQMFGKIGNGGLCLRKVTAFRDACERYAADIAYFNSQAGPLYNEDIFWALIPGELLVPNVETALDFAYDLKPQVCHKLHHRQLPMGCHGFMHKRRIGFWKEYIPFIPA